MTSELHAQPGATEPPSRPMPAQWWRMPFSADTWRQTCYILVALPVGLVSLPLALLGGYRVAAGLQRGLARRYLALPMDGLATRGTAGRVIAHGVLSLPLNLVSLVVVGYLWSLVPLNLGYPLRPGTMGSYQHSWGGPSLAGAWAVHAAGGLVFLFVTPWVVKGITRVQGRLARRLLGPGRPERWPQAQPIP